MSFTGIMPTEWDSENLPEGRTDLSFWKPVRDQCRDRKPIFKVT